MKRAFDIVFSFIGLVALAPLLAAIALAITIGDGGPVFFSQERLGQFGKPFRIHKFRTMIARARQIGIPLTVGHDPHITGVGRWLRLTKLDELPQLWNVLMGEMSLVGPRPEVTAYLDLIRQQAPLVLGVRPGITGPASIKYRGEAELLAAQADPHAFYDRILLPDKLRINEMYATSHSFMTDLGYLWATIFLRGHGAKCDTVSPHYAQKNKAA